LRAIGHGGLSRQEGGRRQGGPNPPPPKTGGDKREQPVKGTREGTQRRIPTYAQATAGPSKTSETPRGAPTGPRAAPPRNLPSLKPGDVEILKKPPPPPSTIPDSQPTEGVVFDEQGLNASQHAPPLVPLPQSPPPPTHGRERGRKDWELGGGRARGQSTRPHPPPPSPHLIPNYSGSTRIDALPSVPRGRMRQEKDPSRTLQRRQGPVEKEKELGPLLVGRARHEAEGTGRGAEAPGHRPMRRLPDRPSSPFPPPCKDRLSSS
jgi:hypothetical protein